MSKSIKLKDNTYLDSRGITHNRTLLNTILERLLSQKYSGVDANDYTNTGIYYLTRDCINVPSNWIYLVVFRALNTTDMVQLGINAGNSTIYVRNYNGTSWSTWHTVFTV